MSTAAFLKRLQTELPLWVQRGWVQEQHRQSILDHVARQAQDSPRYLVFVFSALGALLFGAGVITFFAANWGMIPKLAKLLMLFGALGVCYAAAGFCFARTHLQNFAQALVLLAVLLFGANISLIAQIYHIDAHYPDGVLLWALGALLAAAMAPSQLALAAAVLLATLWSGMEQVDFDSRFHWPFLLFLVPVLALVYRHNWIGALRTALVALLVWAALTLLNRGWFGGSWLAGERVALLQLYLFAGIALYIVARGMQWYPRWAPFAAPIVTAGALWAVAALFLLAFPELQKFAVAQETGAGISNIWIFATAAILVIVAGLMAWRYQDTELSTLPLYRQGAFGWLVAAGALSLANLLAQGQYAGWAALGYNLLAFSGVAWLVLTGVDRGERRIVNLGFAFFAILLLARYFDTFWTLLNRSYFFMVGGALLLVAGFVLEHARRRVTARIDESVAGK